VIFAGAIPARVGGFLGYSATALWGKALCSGGTTFDTPQPAKSHGSGILASVGVWERTAVHLLPNSPFHNFASDLHKITLLT
jgi:hypothetical protein